MLIYKHYTQEALDKQYNNRLNAADHEIHLNQWELLSREAERKYTGHKNISYGDLEREKLDIFPSEKPGAKTLVFIHGGYWYKHNPSDFYLIAEAFRSYGFTTVLISYPLMPDFLMDQLVVSCRKAIGWLAQNLSHYNGDPKQLYVAGHSAGGHLASMMMATFWPQYDTRLAPDTVKGVCAISGLYNLTPVQLCYVNEIIKMDTEMALRNSPVQLLPQTPCSLVLAVGGDETIEYKEQSRELFTNWTGKNADIELLEIPGLNHFSILTTMLDRSSVLHKAMCRLMGEI
jgi:arylformamidase